MNLLVVDHNSLSKVVRVGRETQTIEFMEWLGRLGSSYPEPHRQLQTAESKLYLN